MKIFFASKNKGKIKEVTDILGNEFELSSLLDIKDINDIEETGSTFEENAFIKAKAVYEITGISAIGDDSGLEVEQLDGAPGVFSARYSGANANDENNNKKLLQELARYPAPHHAQFVCTAVFYDGNNKIITKGFVKGQIISQPRGDNGFGYDPLFLPDGYDRTTAEMTLEEKNKISHRAKAFAQMKNVLLNNKG